MKNNSEKQEEIILLELGIGKIKSFDCNFRAYNTEFWGVSHSDSFVIDGENCKKAHEINEFCYDYDGLYHQLHILDVYKLPSGKLFASTEIANGVYAFWCISLSVLLE